MCQQSITEYRTAQRLTFYLVSSSNILLFSINVDSLSNVGALLLQSHQHVACLVVKALKGAKGMENVRWECRQHRASRFLPLCFLTFVRVVVTDLFDGVPHHLLVVHIGPRCDLTAEKNHASLTNRFCKTHTIRFVFFYSVAAVWKQLHVYSCKLRKTHHRPPLHLGPASGEHPGRRHWSDRRSYLAREINHNEASSRILISVT